MKAIYYDSLNGPVKLTKVRRLPDEPELRYPRCVGTVKEDSGIWKKGMTVEGPSCRFVHLIGPKAGQFYYRCVTIDVTQLPLKK